MHRITPLRELMSRSLIITQIFSIDRLVSCLISWYEIPIHMKRYFTVDDYLTPDIRANPELFFREIARILSSGDQILNWARSSTYNVLRINGVAHRAKTYSFTWVKPAKQPGFTNFFTQYRFYSKIEPNRMNNDHEIRWYLICNYKNAGMDDESIENGDNGSDTEDDGYDHTTDGIMSQILETLHVRISRLESRLCV